MYILGDKGADYNNFVTASHREISKHNNFFNVSVILKLNILCTKCLNNEFCGIQFFLNIYWWL